MKPFHDFIETNDATIISNNAENSLAESAISGNDARNEITQLIFKHVQNQQ